MGSATPRHESGMGFYAASLGFGRNTAGEPALRLVPPASEAVDLR